LIDGQHLLKQCFELNLPPGPSRLHVRQDFFQVADASRKALHFPKSLVHLFQALADETKGLAQSLLKRRMEFLIDRLAHFLELARVIRLDGDQPRLDGLSQLLETLVVA